MKKFFGVILALVFSTTAFAQPTRWEDTTKRGWDIGNRPLERNRYSGPLKLESPLYAEAGFNIFLPAEDRPVNALEAGKVLTISGVTADGQTVTIGTRVYEFDTNSAITSGRVEVDVSGGVTASLSIDALEAAITGDDSAVVSVEASDATTLTVAALVAGVSGNSIAIAETLTNGSWAGAAVVLSGGLDGTVAEPGEFIFAGGYMYYTEVENLVSGANWKAVALAEFSGEGDPTAGGGAAFVDGCTENDILTYVGGEIACVAGTLTAASLAQSFSDSITLGISDSFSVTLGDSALSHSGSGTSLIHETGQYFSITNSSSSFSFGDDELTIETNDGALEVTGDIFSISYLFSPKKSSGVPVACAAPYYGVMYFDTTDNKMCQCIDTGGAVYVWKAIHDYSTTCT